MNLQDDIILTVLQAKNKTGCMATTFIAMEKNGEDVKCCERKMMTLVKWIKIMEDYYCLTYLNDRGIVNLPCLTLAQAQELLAKLKGMIE